MNEIVVYGVPGSPFVRAVQLGLEEKRLPYRMEVLNLRTRDKDEHQKYHPFGRVPVIDYGDYRLYETQAILRYLDAMFPEPRLQPTNPREIGRMSQIIGINDCYLFPKVAAVIVFNRIVGPVLLGRSPDEKAITEAMPMANTCVVELNRLLGDQKYLVGDYLSIADLLLAPQLDFFAETKEGRDLLRDTALANWLKRMNERPSMQRTRRPENLRSAA